MPTKLSILICTLESRTEKFLRLQSVLKSQTVKKPVEIISLCDHGELTIGAKRQKLLESTTSEYVAFIDDDDLVPNDYVDKILHGLKNNPDCLNLNGVIFLSTGECYFKHSLEYKEWYDNNNVYYRMPNHLNTIKRDLALRVGYKNLSRGEDYDFSQRLLPLLKTENVVPGILYYYYSQG